MTGNYTALLSFLPLRSVLFPSRVVLPPPSPSLNYPSISGQRLLDMTRPQSPVDSYFVSRKPLKTLSQSNVSIHPRSFCQKFCKMSPPPSPLPTTTSSPFCLSSTHLPSFLPSPPFTFFLPSSPTFLVFFRNFHPQPLSSSPYFFPHSNFSRNFLSSTERQLS